MRRPTVGNVSGTGKQSRAIVVVQQGVGPLARLISQDAGAAAAVVELFRDSATPAAADILHDLQFFGRSGTLVKRQYGGVKAKLIDATNTAEKGEVIIESMSAGALADRLHVGAGAYMEGATGGDKGAGTINATQVFVQGGALPFQKEFISTAQIITTAGLLTLAHGLGTIPKLVQIWLNCTTAEFNYTIGDTVPVDFAESSAGGVGAAIVPDATNLVIRYGSKATVFQLLDKTTGAGAVATNANWTATFKAWA